MSGPKKKKKKVGSMHQPPLLTFRPNSSPMPPKKSQARGKGKRKGREGEVQVRHSSHPAAFRTVEGRGKITRRGGKGKMATAARHLHVDF